jgi:hypothetical protein
MMSGFIEYPLISSDPFSIASPFLILFAANVFTTKNGKHLLGKKVAAPDLDLNGSCKLTFRSFRLNWVGLICVNQSVAQNHGAWGSKRREGIKAGSLN